jgi:predicted TIM-barrel fold metal-dependent hydrolase
VVRHASVYVDISAYANLYNHLPWEAYIKYGAEDKMLFASDYPLFGFKDTLSALKSLNLPRDFERKILGENAMKIIEAK